jgi:hypothetical protein
MSSPLKDAPVAAPSPERAAARVAGFALLPLLAIIGLVAVALIGGVVFLLWPKPPPSSVITSRPTPSMLVAVRDLARLETTELHIEKVIDLSDKQSRLFGLIQATDAILLVAVGRATIGIDLSKLRDSDVSMDPTTKVARLRLPKPELLSAALDERATYVYTRTTSALARRNEALESHARREALAAIEKAAMEDDVEVRAKAQAERQLTALLTQLGASSVEITWR